jgi:ribosomal protein S18 acetylase RimI-like enzyme
LSNERIKLKNVEFSQLPKLLSWYNRMEDYGYATGMASSVTLDELGKIFLNAYNNEEEIFAGIHSNYSGDMLGLIRGRIAFDVFWIYVMITDRDYQAMGYGTSALSMLLEHLKSNAGVREVLLAVAEENPKGKAFWLKNGFTEVGKTESEIILNGRECTAVIMRKKI